MRNHASRETRSKRPSKSEVLEELSFGSWVAEGEEEQLGGYFLGTDVWDRLLSGKSDVIFGSKGSGKSALANSLARANAAVPSGVTVILGENLQGEPVFRDVTKNPPASEGEFKDLWKIYFLSLVGKFAKENDLDGADLKRVIAYLEDRSLLPAEWSLRRALRSIRSYMAQALQSGPEAEVKFDTNTGAPTGFAMRMAPSSAQNSPEPPDFEQFGEYLNLADKGLGAVGQSVWIVLDRLDVAFESIDSDVDVEKMAIRALVRVQLDMRSLSRIRPKTFLRSDIWQVFSQDGFREGDHLAQMKATIKWTPPKLLDLLVRRAIGSKQLRNYAGSGIDYDRMSAEMQLALLSRILPDYIERVSPFEWIMTNVRDGLGPPLPRELIHLFSQAVEIQADLLGRGAKEPSGDKLFSQVAFVRAFTEVSENRLTSMLYQEYPHVVAEVERLKKTKFTHTSDELMALWEIDRVACDTATEELIRIGFFESENGKQPRFKISPIYGPAMGVR